MEETLIAEERNMLELTVDEEAAGKKLGRVLRRLPGFSASKLRSVKYADRGLLLNGAPAHSSALLNAGDVIRVLLDDSENRSARLIPVQGPLDILYEDPVLLIVNKPAGVVCHPSKGHLIDSLANFAAFHLGETDPRASIHFAGRLDKDTSGLVVIAKNSVTAERLNLEKNDGRFVKTYLALAEGILDPEAGEITIPMEEFRTDKDILMNRRGDAEHGKPAATLYKVLEKITNIGPEEEAGSPVSLLSITIPTGRMHQIRFHLSEIGHPLLGDPLYGNGSASGMERSALHAAQVSFIHPFSGERLAFEAPLPDDMRRLIP